MPRRRLVQIDRRNERMIYILVGDDSERIPVYNQLLKSVSPTFKQLVESMEEGCTELEILGVSKKIMSIIIEFIYHTFEDGEVSLPITDFNVHELLYAAIKFELEDIQLLCQNYLEQIEINLENCIQLFIKTPESTSKSVRRTCMEFILTSLNELMNTLPFCNLTYLNLLTILREGRAKEKCSENLLCEATTFWLQHRTKERSTKVRELVEEFPCKEHKRLIIQTLRDNPNPDIQNLAFDLLMDLYTSEPTSMVDDGEGSDIDNPLTPESTINNNSNSSLSETPVKRPALPCSSSSSAKKRKRSSISDENPSSTSNLIKSPENLQVTSSSSSSNNSSSNVNGSCPMAQKVPTAYFMARRKGGGKQICVLNLINFEIKPLKTTIPPELCNLKNSALQYYRGRIFFMGGKSSESGASSTSRVFVLNLEQNTWTTMEMLQSRYDFQTIRLNNWIYAIGGRQKRADRKDSTFINYIEKLHLQEDEGEMGEWIKVNAVLNKSRNNCGLVVVNGKIYAIGGVAVIPNVVWKASDVCEIYDPTLPESEQWKVLKAVLCIPRYGMVAVVTDEGIYSLGGRNRSVEKLNTVEILKPGSDCWELRPPMVKDRVYASAVYLKQQNAIFVFGGDSDRNPTIEKLDLRKKEWTLISENCLPGNENYYSLAFRTCD